MGALMQSRQQLANDTRHLGMGANDTVMRHVSVRAVGEIAGQSLPPNLASGGLASGYFIMDWATG